MTCQAESIVCAECKKTLSLQQGVLHRHKADALRTHLGSVSSDLRMTGGVVTGTICLEKLTLDGDQARGHRRLETILWTPELRG